MSRLVQIQDAFQDRLLHGSDAILAHLGEGARLLGAYDYAYTARLVEVMAKDFEYVHALLGDDGFDEAARAYVAAHPSTFRSIRWLGHAFADWLRATPPWDDTPLLAEMAAFEWALGLAFDAPDSMRLGPDALAAVPPDQWAGLRFDLHCAFSLVETAWGVVDFRQALADEREPDGPPEALDAPVTWAVWREPEGLTVRYRTLDRAEAAAAAALAAGRPFAALCEAAAEAGDPDDAAVRVAGHLRHWIDAGWIAGLADDAVSR